MHGQKRSQNQHNAIQTTRSRRISTVRLTSAACDKSLFRYLLEKCEKSPLPHAAHTLADAFRFQVETRLCDCVIGQVSYELSDEFVMLILVVHVAYPGLQ
jgi:hypothetical protein